MVGAEANIFSLSFFIGHLPSPLDLDLLFLIHLSFLTVTKDAFELTYAPSFVFGLPLDINGPS